MSFVFSVTAAGRLPVAGVSYVEGTMQSGSLKGGEIAMVEGNPNRKVALKSVALVNAHPATLHILTIAINEPDFPLDELPGCRLIG